jgi:opacity protein-like surface antigen
MKHKLKYIFVALSTITVSLNAQKIGENHLGAGIGFGEVDFTLSGSIKEAGATIIEGSESIKPSGFSYALTGNYNIYEDAEMNYGVDIPFLYIGSPGMDESVDGDKFEVEVNTFQLMARPYYKMDKLSLYLNLGLSYYSVDTSIEELGKGDVTAFSYGLGFEYDFTESLRFSPSVYFSEAKLPSIVLPSTTALFDLFGDVDLMNVVLPFHYSLSDSIDLTLSYILSDVDNGKVSGSVEGVTGDITLGSSVSYWLLGASMKF